MSFYYTAAVEGRHMRGSIHVANLALSATLTSTLYASAL